MNAGKLLRTIVCLGATLGVPAFADILDFSGGVPTGTLTGNNSTATTTDTSITAVTGIGTPLNNGLSTAITGGILTINANSGSFASGVYTYTGGSFSITGTDATAGASGTLVSGSISKLTVDLAGVLSLLSGPNTVDTNLQAFYGESAPGYFLINGNVHVAQTSGGSTGGAYTATTFSVDLPDSPVPEPGSILLLGSALVGLSQLVRRRYNKA